MKAQLNIKNLPVFTHKMTKLSKMNNEKRILDTVETRVVKKCFKQDPAQNLWYYNISQDNEDACSLKQRTFYLNNARQHLKRKHNTQFENLLEIAISPTKESFIDN